jgi:glycyl-tRNA synthetase alpha chain
MGGFDMKPVAGELTYGLERLAMYIQDVDNVYDLRFNDAGVGYGDVFLENERQMSTWNFEVADTDTLFDSFRKSAAECERSLAAKLPIAAYEQAIKASHTFNLLQARGVISVAERQAYIGRVRDLAKASCAAWMEKNGWAA